MARSSQDIDTARRMTAADSCADFARRVIDWQRQHGRHGLPWQATNDAYRIWVSEIMLQQTQVAAVIPYYQRFMARFPDVQALAAASADDVLAHWSGLGYYARARNLHAAAQAVVAQQGGRFPTDSVVLATLPGIGRSTAAAIAAFSVGERSAILDGNVKRVFARHFAVEGFTGATAVQAQLWALADRLLPVVSPALTADMQSYTQGLMDLGANVCSRSRPRCSLCPLQDTCRALAQDRVAELPAPRPRKVRPERSSLVRLLRRPGEVLLERRPASGIWGGLWSFPEAAALPAHWPGEARRFEVRHVFTHFTLQLTVQEHCLPAGYTPALAEPASLHLHWHALPAALQLGLPAPVRLVLEQVAAGADGAAAATFGDF